MRLLLDQNLSWRLVQQWQDIFPGSAHVRGLGLEEADDTVVWSTAARDDYVLITKDGDFDDDSLFGGPPPKVIHVLAGNASTSAVDELIRSSLDAIERFETDGSRSLELGGR